MGLTSERVQLVHLGQGGQRGDVPLVKEAEDILASLAVLVQDDRCAGKGSLNIRITVEKTGEGAVLIAYSIKRSDPPMTRRALPALVNPETGDLYAWWHRQEALDLPAPERLRVANKEV